MGGIDAKEIKVLSTNLEKAVKEKLPAAHITDILNRLKNEVVATEQVLRETKIGMQVNRLKTHTDTAVAELARTIVGNWKKDVQGTKAKPAASSDTKATKQEGSPVAKVEVKKDVTPAGRKSSVADPTKRNKANDHVAWEIYEDPTRDKSLGMLYDGLCVGSDESPDVILAVAKAVESSVFRNAKSNTTNPVYRSTMRSLFLNLKDPRNPSLRKRVVSGDISPERLSTMNSEEMASNELKEEIKQIEKENMDNAFVPKAEKSTTDQFQCGKCKQRKVSYSQAQTRSADEPMTTFCECEVCGNRWKFS